MSWVRIPPEQLFFFFLKKELFGLVVLPCFIFIGLRVFMYGDTCFMDVQVGSHAVLDVAGCKMVQRVWQYTVELC